ncbi:MAG: DUF4149 domain-containing protein [Acidobacteria bacterium]|nr:DUF4149 domain-containing protein [Acidobacteriota bacterium]
MPNWTFLALHFFHTMALVIWVGGMVTIGAIVAPVAFREAPDRGVAGRIVGLSLQRFDLLVVVCIVSLVVTSGLMAQWYGRWSVWYAVQYACIALMSLSALVSMTIVAPKMRSLRRRLEDGAMPTHGAEFDRLHQFAALSMRFNLACGTIAILFS